MLNPKDLAEMDRIVREHKDDPDPVIHALVTALRAKHAALRSVAEEINDLQERMTRAAQDTSLVESQALAIYGELFGKVQKPCTCHPSDNPPVPCPRKYALRDCRVAAGQCPSCGEANVK